MLTRDTIQHLRELEEGGASIRRISILLGISRNTVRRYVRTDRPAPVRVDPPWLDRAAELYGGPCMGNAAGVARALRAEGYGVEERVVQRWMRRLRERGDLAPPSVLRTHVEPMAASVGWAE